MTNSNYLISNTYSDITKEFIGWPNNIFYYYISDETVSGYLLENKINTLKHPSYAIDFEKYKYVIITENECENIDAAIEKFEMLRKSTTPVSKSRMSTMHFDGLRTVSNAEKN